MKKFNNIYKENWICFKTNPRQEFFVENLLKSKGYEIFLPYYIKTIKHARKKNQIKSPIFPTYGFLKFDGNISSLYEIKYTRGIKNYLHKFDGLPRIVPEKVINAIKFLQNQDGSIKLDPRRFATGDNVEIIEGALCGLTAVFKEQVDEFRSKLLVNLLGRMNLINVNSELIDHA